VISAPTTLASPTPSLAVSGTEMTNQSGPAALGGPTLVE
jgi:hypothetical protein